MKRKASKRFTAPLELEDPKLLRRQNLNPRYVNKVKTKTRLKRAVTLKKQKAVRGVVYLSHIPHGFYEEQMEKYFKQFGDVTAVSVPKSKLGRAKGYAFVEFRHPAVAKIAAETMNNYLMFNRLLKAKYIPPAEQKPRYFLHAREARENHKTVPEKAALRVKKNRKIKNRVLKTSLEEKLVKKLKKKSRILAKNMENLGLDVSIQIAHGKPEPVVEKKTPIESNKNDNTQESQSEEEESSSEQDDMSSELDDTFDSQLSDEDDEEPRPKKMSLTKKKIKNKQERTPQSSKPSKQRAYEKPTSTSEAVKNIKAKLNKSSDNLKAKRKIKKTVMEVDQNEEEITFKTPPNVTKKIIKVKKSPLNKKIKK